MGVGCLCMITNLGERGRELGKSSYEIGYCVGVGGFCIIRNEGERGWEVGKRKKGDRCGGGRS